jgi:guanine nucleotide-binding protein G(i) subunit alpha
MHIRTALQKQNKILHQPEFVRVLRDINRDTASLIVHHDTDSIVTVTSVSSSKWSLQFDFDKELLVTNVYERWIRKFAKPRVTNTQLHNDAVRDDLRLGESGRISLPKPPLQTGQNPVTQLNSDPSEGSLQQSPSLGEQHDFPRVSAMSIELQPLERRQITSDPQQQAKESQGIIRSLKDSLTPAGADVIVTILGSKTSKQVLEGMMLEGNMHTKCYPEDQLCLFRPTILMIVLDCSRYLVDALKHHITTESDPIKDCLQYISKFDRSSVPGITLRDEFATAMTQIMEHPRTKTLMEDQNFILPANGK